jgi:hypothetical protein
MGPFNYEVACAHLEAANLYCDPEKSPEEKDALRKRVFDFAGTGSFDFDTLCDKVLASMAELEIRSRRAA